MGLARFQALPPYPGGKRRLLGRIFKHIPKPNEVPVFVDAFLGGGAVSLMAKARGYQVLCNDLAERSVLIGRALIGNDRVHLSESDALRLFVPDPHAGSFVRARFAPNVLTTKHAEFLDNALAITRGAAEPKRSLLLLLLAKYLLRCRPMGNFGAKTIVRQLEERAWESMNPNYVRDIFARTIHGHPKVLVERLCLQVNRGVFYNARRNEVHQLNAFEFVPKVQGDVLYLDPPYSGTQAYEMALRPLDEILAGCPLEPTRSPFSAPDGMVALGELLNLAAHFPLWVISYGNARTTLDDLVKLVEKFRPVQHAEAIRYIHCTGLSGKEHRERNRELLVVARRKS